MGAVVKLFYYSSFWAGRKIVQIRQTEPAGACPEGVRVYAEWFGLAKTQGDKTEEISHLADFYIKLYYFNFL